MNEPITILIVDDHQVVRQGVRAFFGDPARSFCRW
jgi:DNA-binding NarL/FixJ family response regulator